MARFEDENGTRAYTESAGLIGLMSPAEELECARLVVQGDRTARAKMINKNLLLVVKLARMYLNRGLDLDDLIQEGNLGLIRAVDKFDPERGFKFSTYAVNWIKSFIERGIMNSSSNVRLPVHVRRKLNLCMYTAKRLSLSLGRSASAEEIALNMDKPVEEIELLLSLAKNPISLDDDAEDSVQSMKDALVDEADPLSAAIEQSEQQCVAELLDVLPAQEREVISRRFGFGDSDSIKLREVGTQLNMSKQWVSQVQKSALDRLRRTVSRGA